MCEPLHLYVTVILSQKYGYQLKPNIPKMVQEMSKQTSKQKYEKLLRRPRTSTCLKRNWMRYGRLAPNFYAQIYLRICIFSVIMKINHSVWYFWYLNKVSAERIQKLFKRLKIFSKIFQKILTFTWWSSFCCQAAEEITFHFAKSSHSVTLPLLLYRIWTSSSHT